MTSFGCGLQGSRNLLHDNVYTKVYGELINFVASYSHFIAMLFLALKYIMLPLVQQCAVKYRWPNPCKCSNFSNISVAVRTNFAMLKKTMPFAATLYHDLVELQLVHDPSVFFVSILKYESIYHDGAAMTSSAVDAMLILACMPEYYQIADNAPFTSNAIERSDCDC